LLKENKKLEPLPAKIEKEAIKRKELQLTATKEKAKKDNWKMRALEAEENVAGLERDVVAHIAGGMQAIQRAVADDRHYVLVPMWWPMK
jgi:hypothetical protein